MSRSPARTWGPRPRSARCPPRELTPGLDELVVRHPGGPIRTRLGTALLPWGDLVMMRRQLLNLKGLAEHGDLSPARPA